tara:strand:+ start:261 stop:593 length:333 start_codon:yes stop_codon:yes gene_type:complete
MYSQTAPLSASNARTAVPAATESPSCVFVSTDDFEQMNVNNDSWIDGVDLLKQIKTEGETFTNLDFFVPYHNPNLGEHAPVTDISSRCQFVQYNRVKMANSSGKLEATVN